MAPRALVVFGSVAHNADMPSPRFAWLAAPESGVCQGPAPAVHRTAGGSVYVLPPLGVHRGLGLRRPTHLATRPLGDVSTPATGSSAAIRRAVFSETPLGVAISLHVCSAQYLNLVSFEHIDHPCPRRKPNLQRFSDPVVLRAGGQNFPERIWSEYSEPAASSRFRLTARARIAQANVVRGIRFVHGRAHERDCS